MSKRRDTFERRARDAYATPYDAAALLSPLLDEVEAFGEPCAGDGALVCHLERLGHRCELQMDLEPRWPGAMWDDAGDALELTSDDLKECSHIITNPPWPRARGAGGQPTTGLIWHLSKLRPSWFLLSLDFCANDYFVPLLPYCRMIAAIGRVRWMPGTKMDGFDNCAWYLFDQSYKASTIFTNTRRTRATYAPEIEDLL